MSLQADGSREIMLQAGMVLPNGSSHQRKQKPERVTNLEAAPGKGTCAVSADAQPDVNGYIALVADDSVKMRVNRNVLEMDANGIKIFMKASSRRAMQPEGLPSVNEFCVTMFTFNSAGCRPLAPNVEVTPQ